MARHENEPPLTEPVIIPCQFISGVSVQSGEGAVCLVGWAFVPSIEGDNGEERRIITRLALSPSAARQLASQLRRAIPKEH